MTEPKWWPKGEVPTEPGMYYTRTDDGFHGCWDNPKERDGGADRQFYGPIPQPPREPPKLRRFTAKHVTYGRVSGVYCPEKNTGSECKHQIFFWGKKEFDYFWVEDRHLSDIQWLDKE